MTDRSVNLGLASHSDVVDSAARRRLGERLSFLAQGGDARISIVNGKNRYVMARLQSVGRSASVAACQASLKGIRGRPGYARRPRARPRGSLATLD